MNGGLYTNGNIAYSSLNVSATSSNTQLMLDLYLYINMKDLHRLLSVLRMVSYWSWISSHVVSYLMWRNITDRIMFKSFIVLSISEQSPDHWHIIYWHINTFSFQMCLLLNFVELCVSSSWSRFYPLRRTSCCSSDSSSAPAHTSYRCAHTRTDWQEVWLMILSSRSLLSCAQYLQWRSRWQWNF